MRPADIVETLQHGKPLGLADPYALYAELRESAPVFRTDAGLWVLTRYDDVSKALRHRGMSMMAAVRGNPRYATSVTLQTMAESMLFFDAADDHARQRRLVSQAFNNTTVRELRPWVEARADALLDGLGDSFDFMGDFADQIPVAVICRMLGVPDEDIDTFKDWNYLITTATGVSLSDEHMTRVDEATTNLRAYLDDLLDARAKAPGDDLLTRLIEARDSGDRLSREETTGLAFLLLVAGSDTTSAFLGGALAALLRFPAELAALRADPALMPNAIEELMRFEAPVHFGLIRTTTDPLVLEDAEIGVDQPVWTIFSAGNRDPRRFPDPDRLDLTRQDTRHLGFGFGIHTCLGAALARMESSVALRALLDRFDGIRLVDGAVPWRDHGNLRTLGPMPVSVSGVRSSTER